MINKWIGYYYYYNNVHNLESEIPLKEASSHEIHLELFSALFSVMDILSISTYI